MTTKLLPRTGLLRFAKRILTKFRNVAVQPGPKPRIYPTYAAACQACEGCDYEFDQIVQTVHQKTITLREKLSHSPTLSINSQDTQLLMGLELAKQLRPGDAIHVLDHGGACGAHYFTAKAFLGNTCSLRWHVVETPAMAAKAKVLENDELKFHPTLMSAKNACPAPDLVFSSGTLQCVPEPHATLQELLSFHSPYILLNRLGLNSGANDVITVHTSRLRDNGPGPLPEGIQDCEVRYPFQFISKQAIDQAILRDYDLRLQFDDPSGIFQVGPDQIVGCSYLLQRRN